MADLPLLPNEPFTAPPLRRLAVLHHPKVPAAQRMLDDLCRLIARHGAEPITASVWASETLPALLATVDACLTLGGDGSMLRAARIAAPLGIPVLGINLGRLGFLAEIEPGDVAARLPALLGGNYWIEERMTLAAKLWRDGQPDGCFDCLNEVVVARRHLARVVRIEVTLDGHELTTYTADGVLVATPTGSTGYSLAAGGPILHPEVRNMVLTPISAHLSLRSPLVLPASTEVRLRVHTDHEAGASFDGQSDHEMHSGDAVVVTVGPHVARFLRSQERTYFYHTLIHKLGIRH